MRLKDMYDNANCVSLELIIGEIVSRTEAKIMERAELPFYLSNLDTAYFAQSHLKDVLKKEEGIIISFFPNGVKVEDLI